MTKSTTSKKRNTPLDRQAERLGDVFGDLVRWYQFRDRNEICCHGVSVTQCYAMDALSRRGPLTMGRLAELLYLDVSTVTRVVDQLLRGGHVERVADPDDRRVVRARLTAEGERITLLIRSQLLDGFREVLSRIPGDSRDVLIDGIEQLYHAFVARGCCVPDDKAQ